MPRQSIKTFFAVWSGLLLCADMVFAQPDWESIKANARPFVALPDEYETPYKLPMAVGGWEDGIYISRDGLNLYCVYLPVDVFSLIYVGNGDITNFSPYRRGPTFGMDLTTNPIGAKEWLHGDILYSHRNSVTEPFPEWQLSNLARPIWTEGAVQIIMKDDSTADIFAYTSNHDSPPNEDDRDILIFRNSNLNPSGIGEFLAPLANSDFVEDNPHFERLDGQSLVLFFDSDRPGGKGGLDIWYTTSSDDAASWAEPQPATSINTELDNQMPHLFRDSTGQWWLYFMSDDPITLKSGIYRARQSIPGDWNSWSKPELVIGTGNTFAVGEPTLTSHGDIAFVVVYDADSAATPTDRFDADPWFLPRKDSPTAVNERNRERPDEFQLLQNFPNPFNPETVISYTVPLSPSGALLVQLKIYNLKGQLVRTLVKGYQGAGAYSVTWDGRDDQGQAVASGVYLYQFRAGEEVEVRRMLLLR
ncbi:MAG: FlgD immunoglobulin-like domain containing protein [candidate division KSB1 bacterium]|nr:FlgD immunoglobulin-like domain containing protein [candidate division KSB1 bacterium]